MARVRVVVVVLLEELLPSEEVHTSLISILLNALHADVAVIFAIVKVNIDGAITVHLGDLSRIEPAIALELSSAYLADLDPTAATEVFDCRLEAIYVALAEGRHHCLVEGVVAAEAVGRWGGGGGEEGVGEE